MEKRYIYIKNTTIATIAYMRQFYTILVLSGMAKFLN